MNNNLDPASLLPKRLSYDSLKEMTNGFSKELGRGTYGIVYEGVNKDGEKLAVKVLHDMPSLADNDQLFEKEFHTLACLQHPNIVRLIGYCHDTQRECVIFNEKNIWADSTKRALCFEHMQNGGLDKHLFDESSGHDWHTRYAIIKGVCDGLKYLHEELKHPILHLDLKPANILLDEDMLPKLADFGLSRFFGDERTQITKSHIGTIGYLPPEFINQHVVSNKFDIFSLGVVIIKIMTGKTGYSICGEMSSPHKFIELVHEKWRTRLHTTKSVGLLESYSEQVKICIKIALSCVKVDRHDRPSIGDIVSKLNGTEAMINATPPNIGNIVNGPSEIEIRSQIPDESPSAAGSSMDQGKSEELSNTQNLFGAVVDDCRLDKMAIYMGKPKTREDRAQEALYLRNDDNKEDKASKYVRGLIPSFGSIIRGTLCLVYNATGETLSKVTSHDWFGHISRPPYPEKIGNGQWAAFYHYYPIFKVGSVAAVVYRGKNKDGKEQDYLLAWCSPSLVFLIRNKSYCEIGGVDNFKDRWHSLKKKLVNSDYASNVKAGGSEIDVKIGKGDRPTFTAIISCP
ncbi:unnamed protein product [Alopecurus aequalis]